MNRFQYAGFTLIELMVTVAIVAIVATFGVPGFQNVIKDGRMVTAANELAADLVLARSEAVKRGATVTVCIRDSADISCDSGGSWSDGWLVFVDDDGDGALDDDGDTNHCEDGSDDDCLLRVHEPMTADLVLNYGRTRITFDTRGYSVGFNGTFSLCDDRGVSKARGKVLSNTGRLRGAVSADAVACP